MLVLRTSNYKGAIIRPIAPILKQIEIENKLFNCCNINLVYVQKLTAGLAKSSSQTRRHFANATRPPFSRQPVITLYNRINTVKTSE